MADYRHLRVSEHLYVWPGKTDNLHHSTNRSRFCAYIVLSSVLLRECKLTFISETIILNLQKSVDDMKVPFNGVFVQVTWSIQQVVACAWGHLALFGVISTSNILDHLRFQYSRWQLTVKNHHLVLSNNKCYATQRDRFINLLAAYPCFYRRANINTARV